MKRLSPVRLVVALVCAALIAASWWGVGRARQGLIVRQFTQDGIPMRLILPQSAANIPGVLVAHGFAGSQQLMLGYGYALAHAGYGALLWDFGGHGANPNALDRDGDSLQTDVDAAYAALAAQPEIDAARVALLGHSMGSGAVMQAGVRDADRYAATIAVSPTGADVTTAVPRNLLLTAGSLEAPFVANAERLLEQAGGPSQDFGAGLARALVIIPNAEHISILFRWLSHETAIYWLNLVFGVQENVQAFRDWRVAWYGLHIVAWLGLLTAVAPALPIRRDENPARRRPPWHWVALLIGPLPATAVLWLLSRLGEVGTFGGLLVGGALALWFGVLGLVWLLAGFRLTRPSGGDAVWGVVLFGALWLAVGALAQLVWLPWLLIPARLLVWPLLALLFFPAQLAAGYAQQGAGFGRRLGWWALQSAVAIAGLALTLAVVPGLFFLALVLPLVPAVFGVMAVAGAAVDRPWAVGLGNAAFFAWLIAAVFPLA